MYNKVIMIGNLTRDMELKYLPSGSALANGAIASSYSWKMQNGEKREDVCFLDFTIFGKAGEIFNQYVRKGSKVMLEGRLVFQQWKAQDGTNRSRHVLNVDTFKFLDSKADSGTTSYNPPSPSPQHQDRSGGETYHQNMNQSPAMQVDIPVIDIDNDEIPHFSQ